MVRAVACLNAVKRPGCVAVSSTGLPVPRTVVAMRLRHCLPVVLLALPAAAAAPGDFAGAPPPHRRVDAPTVHVWTDAKRVHLRFAGIAGQARFLGKVCSHGGIQQLQRVGFETGDTIALDPKRRCAQINIQAEDDDDTFSFTQPEATVIFDLRLGAEQLPADRIRLGAHEKAPESSPFTLNVN